VHKLLDQERMNKIEKHANSRMIGNNTKRRSFLAGSGKRRRAPRKEKER